MDLNKVLRKIAKNTIRPMIWLTREKDGVQEGTAVTEYRKICRYVLEYNKVSFEEKTLNDELYARVSTLIEEILNKKVEYQVSSTAIYKLCINYGNVSWYAQNDYAQEICDAVHYLLDEIWEKSGTVEDSAESFINGRVERKSKYREKMEQILDKKLIEVYCAWGHGSTPGWSGTIVTNDKKIYKYARYNHRWAVISINDIIETKTLNEQEYSKIVKFIETEIVNKDYEDEMIYDVTFGLEINYKGIVKEIINNTDPETKTGIYDLTTTLLKEIWGNSDFIAEKEEFPPEE